MVLSASMDISGKTAVITGAAGGIGMVLTTYLATEGVRCVIVDRSTDLLEPVLKKAGKNAIAIACDFENETDVERLGNELSVRLESVDYIFNVAGIGIYKKVSELDISDWSKTISINLNAPFILIKALMKKLNKNSVIFNIGSGMGVFPAANRAAYCTSKFALRGFSLSLNKELQPFGIDVCLFTLGSVMTGFGTGGIDTRRELERNGKKYLTVTEVVEKIISIIKCKKRDAEYVMYPEGYI